MASPEQRGIPPNPLPDLNPSPYRRQKIGLVPWIVATGLFALFPTATIQLRSQVEADNKQDRPITATSIDSTPANTENRAIGDVISEINQTINNTVDQVDPKTKTSTPEIYVSARSGVYFTISILGLFGGTMTLVLAGTRKGSVESSATELSQIPNAPIESSRQAKILPSAPKTPIGQLAPPE